LLLSYLFGFGLALIAETSENMRDVLLNVFLVTIVAWPILVILFGVRTGALQAEQASDSVIRSILVGAGSAALATFTCSFFSLSFFLTWFAYDEYLVAAHMGFCNGSSG
jgi:hypothetical protein